MIKVTAYHENGNIYGFKMNGHANSGSVGYDLVCAGVSAVSIGSVNAVIQLCNIDPIIGQAGDEGGYLQMVLPEGISDEKRQKAQTLLEGMMVSLETIERDYGSYITISKK